MTWFYLLKRVHPLALGLLFPLVLLVTGLASAGCGLAAEKGSARPATGEGAALAYIEHPSPAALYRQAAAAVTTVDPLSPAIDLAGHALKSASCTVVDGGLYLESDAQRLAWAIYDVGGFDAEPRPDTLTLNFGTRSGAGWIALADFTKGTWVWLPLDDGGVVAVTLPATLGLKDAQDLFFTLAVHDGASLVFTGGQVGEGAPDPDPQPEPDPGPDPDPGPAPELPQVVGAYLSSGYWNTAGVEATMARLDSLGVNFAIDYALTEPEDESWDDEFQAYLDSAQAHGIGIAYWLSPTLHGMNPLNAEAYMDQVVDVVNRLKDEPAITAWYVHDEVLPSIVGDAGTANYSITLPQMQELYQRIHAADPTRPQLNVWCFLPNFELFNLVYTADFTPFGRPAWMSDPAAYETALRDMVRTTCDWVMVDSYPVGAPWLEGGEAGPELQAFALAGRANALRDPAQPLVFVFQAFSWAQYDPQSAAGAHFPTRQQMDGMLSAVHQAGATAALAYSWFDLANPSLPNRNIIGREAALSNLEDVLRLLSTDGWPTVELPATGTEPPEQTPPVCTALDARAVAANE